MNTWNKRFIELAEHISTWSKDPSTKIGVISINPETNNILSTGFNGFARGIEDTTFRLSNREKKYKYIVHGEQNCIYNATRNGISLQNSHMYVYGLWVCSSCASAIVQVGVDTVFFRPNKNKESQDRWKESGLLTKEIFKEAGVNFIQL